MQQVNKNRCRGYTDAGMSNYSANQYDSAFKPQRLQNWCESKHPKERSKAREGYTTFVADDRGRLLPGLVKRGKAWPDFKGTWDLPARIPAHHINPTSRSVEGLKRLKSWGFDPQHTGSNNTDGLQDVGEQSNGDIQQDGAAVSADVASQDAPSSPEQRHKDEHEDQNKVLETSFRIPKINWKRQPRPAMQFNGLPPKKKV